MNVPSSIPEGILFDIGDTLIDSSKIRRKSLVYAAGVLAEKGLAPGAAAFVEVYQTIDRTFHELHLNHLYSDRRIIRRVADTLGLPSTALLEGTFLGEYRNSVRSLLTPDSILREFLLALRKQGCVLGIVSDGSTDEQQESLWRLGILDCFAVCVISEDVGVEKPDAAIFEVALSKLGVAPSNVLMVGDSLERDVLGAQALGMSGALVTGYANCATSNTADLCVASILDLFSGNAE